MNRDHRSGAFPYVSGERVIFRNPEILTTLATYIADDEGWCFIAFEDDSPYLPSRLTVRPSMVHPLLGNSISLLTHDLRESVERNDLLKADNLTDLVKRVIALTNYDPSSTNLERLFELVEIMKKGELHAL